MKAIRVNQYGGPEVMSLEDVVVPEPKKGEVRIKVAAAGLNFIEIYQRSGQYQGALPFTLGAEATGVVDAIGAGVTDVKVGDRVLTVAAQGAYAEYCTAPADKVAPLPKTIDLVTAATLGIQGMTAHYLTHDTFPLKPGHVCLVHAAAGGTGWQGTGDLVRRRGSPGGRSAAAVEKGEAHAAGRGGRVEAALSNLQAPAGGKVATILRAVGVADHHDLPVATAGQMRGVGRLIEDRGQRGVGVLQVVDLLEERHDRDVVGRDGLAAVGGLLLRPPPEPEHAEHVGG